MAEEAQAQSQQYLATLAKLKGVNKSNKKKAHLNSHKVEWMEEWRRLEGQQRRFESDIGEAASMLASLGETNVLDGFDNHRRELVRDVAHRWRELRSTQAEFVRRRETSLGVLDASSTSKRGEEKEAAAAEAPFTDAEVREFGGNFAHYLLESRRWNEGCRSSLEETEVPLAKECTELRRDVFRVIAKDLESRSDLLLAGAEGSYNQSSGGNTSVVDVATHEANSVLALLGELTGGPTSSAASSLVAAPPPSPPPSSSSSSSSLPNKSLSMGESQGGCGCGGSGVGGGGGGGVLKTNKGDATALLGQNTTSSKRISRQAASKRTRAAASQPNPSPIRALAPSSSQPLSPPPAPSLDGGSGGGGGGEIWRDLHGMGDLGASELLVDDDPQQQHHHQQQQQQHQQPEEEAAASATSSYKSEFTANAVATARTAAAAAAAAAAAGVALTAVAASADLDNALSSATTPGKAGSEKTRLGPLSESGEVDETDDIEFEVLLVRSELVERMRALCQKRESSRAAADAECLQATIAAVQLGDGSSSSSSGGAMVKGLGGNGAAVAKTETMAISRRKQQADHSTSSPSTPSPAPTTPAALNDATFSNEEKKEGAASAADASAAAAASIDAAAHDPLGGWPEKEHEIFESTYRQLLAVGRSRERALDRLSLTLPERSKRELTSHANFLDAAHVCSVRKKEALEAWRRGRGEVLEWARTAFVEARAQAAAAAQRAEELAATKARGDELRRQLDALRPGRDASLCAEQALLRKQEDQARAAAEASRVAEAEAQKKRRQAVAEFHAQRSRAEVEAKKEREKVAVAEEAQRLRQRLADAARVQFRSGERREKLDMVQQRAWEAQVREARRLEAIAAIAASVPYAQALAAIAEFGTDPLKATAASENWANSFNPDEHRRDPHAIKQGYSDKQLFANKGFKLGVALRAAGVHQTPAAAAAVRAACPVKAAPYATS
jgi:hypothetical protein